MTTTSLLTASGSRRLLRAREVARLRRQQRFSQTALGDRLDVTASAISQWERGSIQPTTAHIVSLAKVFGVEPDELVYK